MKKLLFLSLILLFTTFAGFSQTIPPPYINYQAVLYDINGSNPNAVLANQSFSTYVNIQDELGNLLYKEEHYASTDANGQITVKIGDGVYLQGTITNFNQINWGTGKYYLIVDFDINGTISSTAPEQLVTVPYTFYAGKAGNGMTAVADNGNGTLTFTYANGQTYITPTLSGIQGPIGPAGQQGPQGAQGVQGVAGANGLNALINTITEPAGANCANGGTKIETGLDANGNGVLDAGEVNGSQTKYVCNGGDNFSSTLVDQYPMGSMFCGSGPTAIVDVTNPVTGKTWMDRNLGASRAAISGTDQSAFGDLYQWGRGMDGHQCRNSFTFHTQSSVLSPDHQGFITNANNWQTPANNSLWQGLNGINNPCPNGYRLPTRNEWNAERISWSNQNSEGAINSILKLPLAGRRGIENNTSADAHTHIFKSGKIGYYYSSGLDAVFPGSYAFHCVFDTISANEATIIRSAGLSVRCIKE
jgi:uncharacterized protein (TIGR02145 family)